MRWLMEVSFLIPSLVASKLSLIINIFFLYGWGWVGGHGDSLYSRFLM